MWISIRWSRTFFVLILIAWAFVLPGSGNGASQETPNGPRPYRNNASATANQQPSQPSTPRNIKQQPSPPSHQTPAQQSSAQQKGKQDRNRWLDPIVVVTAAVLVIYLLILIVYARQLTEMRKSADATRDYARIAADTAQRQLRAYVCFESGFVRFTRPDVPEAHLVFRNFGETPAYDVRTGGVIGYFPYPWDNTLPPPPLNPNVAIIGPNAKLEEHTRMDPPMHGVHVAMLPSPQNAVWVVGRIEYRDAFGQERHTNHRMFCRGPLGIGTFALTPDAEGNDAN